MLHLIVDCVLGGLFATLAAKLFADESDVSSSVESSAAMAAMCMGVDFAAIPKSRIERNARPPLFCDQRPLLRSLIAAIFFLFLFILKCMRMYGI